MVAWKDLVSNTGIGEIGPALCNISVDGVLTGGGIEYWSDI